MHITTSRGTLGSAVSSLGVSLFFQEGTRPPPLKTNPAMIVFKTFLRATAVPAGTAESAY